MRLEFDAVPVVLFGSYTHGTPMDDLDIVRLGESE